MFLAAFRPGLELFTDAATHCALWDRPVQRGVRQTGGSQGSRGTGRKVDRRTQGPEGHLLLSVKGPKRRPRKGTRTATH